MSATPVAVVDALNSLLESQQRSIIRFMGEGSPYLTRATAEVREPLHQMLRNNLRRCEDLYRLVEKLGGAPPAQRAAGRAVPGLPVAEVPAAQAGRRKELIIRRYENALRALGKDPPEGDRTAQRHLADHRAELGTLEAAGVVAAGSTDSAAGSTR